MAASPSPLDNRLLAALADNDSNRWLDGLAYQELPLGKVLYESGDAQTHVYFPTTAIVSLLYVMANGASAEIAVIGNEGIVGISLLMGGESTPSRAVSSRPATDSGCRRKPSRRRSSAGRSTRCCFAIPKP